MSSLTFYFDESIEVAVSQQLALRGVDVVSAHSLAALGDTDLEHLMRATEMGRVMCTYDDDFLVLASQGVEHAGIAFAHQPNSTIGGWIRAISGLQSRTSAEAMWNQVVFLSVK